MASKTNYKRMNQKHTPGRKITLCARLDGSLIALLKARAMERGTSYAAILAQAIKTECNRVQV